MKGKAEKLMEQYDLEVFGIRRGRGTFIYETNQGIKVLKPMKGSTTRIAALDMVLDKVRKETDILVEKYVLGKEENWISENEEGEHCVLKDHLEGKEWNLEDEQELLYAAEILGQLHSVLCISDESSEGSQFPMSAPWYEEVEKRNREMKRTRNFMRNQKRKSVFELLYLKVYPMFEEESLKVMEKLQQSGYEKMWQQAKEKGQLCHGDFTYHNLIHCQGKVAILNFESVYQGIQVDDLYHFLRKALEKNHWDFELFKSALARYEKFRSLNGAEKEYLYLRFAYPEKYWKIANHYYNARKTRIPEKDMKKLELLIEQEKDKDRFLYLMEDLLV